TISVTVAGSAATSATSFMILVPPTIASFSPASGALGTSVTITGTNFSTTPADNIVFFGATRATVTAATATQLTVTVPTGATYAPITVLNTTTGLVAYATRNFTPTFTPNKGSITTADFSPKLAFTAGTNPNSVAIGDIDGDGNADLAVANYGSTRTVSVFRNTGSSGTVKFSTQVDFTTDYAPWSVANGDLDGDGKVDLAVANGSSSNTVSVFNNTGSSGTVSFATKVDFTTGVGPVSLAIGDLDGDGKPDLTVANYGSNTVSVFRNTGSSGTVSYATKVDVATGSLPRSVAIGDLDGDGKPDLAVANEGSDSVSVLRNTGSRGTVSFAAKVDFTTGADPRSVAIGDLDGDGKPDLAVANLSSNTVSVIRNSIDLPTTVADEEPSLYAYPNPSSGLIFVEFDRGVSPAQGVVLTDVVGRQQQIQVEATDRGYEVNVGAISPGLYILSLVDANNLKIVSSRVSIK
ncbi:MAG: FG-GAP-like repeat-containing protein, partial [Cytophagales bacterium]